MSDFINKIITVVLVFLLLIMAPLLISYKTNDIIGRREILNDVEVFIDKVITTSTLTNDDIDKLYFDCNSHGLTVNVTVKRMIATPVYDADLGINKSTYIAVDDKDGAEYLLSMNKGDIVKVSVSEITISHSRRALYKIIGVDEGPLEFSLAGVVG